MKIPINCQFLSLHSTKNRVVKRQAGWGESPDVRDRRTKAVCPVVKYPVPRTRGTPRTHKGQDFSPLPPGGGGLGWGGSPNVRDRRTKALCPVVKYTVPRTPLFSMLCLKKVQIVVYTTLYYAGAVTI